MEAAALSALVEEAAKKSGLVWVRAAGSAEPARGVWHVWQDGAVWVLSGGGEQPLPDLGPRAELTIRSKDKGRRLVTVVADVTRIEPGSPEWDAAVPALLAKRLNLPDGELAPRRWAATSVLHRLTPTAEFVETPDEPSTGSHAAPPPASPATTRVPRPRHLFGRPARRGGRKPGPAPRPESRPETGPEARPESRPDTGPEARPET